MVVLRVVLEDLFALLVLEGADEVVDAALELFAPLLVVEEPARRADGSGPGEAEGRRRDIHLLAELDVELAGAQESQLGRDG